MHSRLVVVPAASLGSGRGGGAGRGTAPATSPFLTLRASAPPSQMGTATPRFRPRHRGASSGLVVESADLLAASGAVETGQVARSDGSQNLHPRNDDQAELGVKAQTYRLLNKRGERCCPLQQGWPNGGRVHASPPWSHGGDEDAVSGRTHSGSWKCSSRPWPMRTLRTTKASPPSDPVVGSSLRRDFLRGEHSEDAEGRLSGWCRQRRGPIAQFPVSECAAWRKRTCLLVSDSSVMASAEAEGATRARCWDS
jgi:hypothetical protein